MPAFGWGTLDYPAKYKTPGWHIKLAGFMAY